MTHRTTLGNAALARTIAFALCALAGLAATSAFALTVTGVVRDHAGKPIEYANVSVAALKLGAVTDEQGRFSLDVPPGSFTLAVSQVGYLAVHLPVIAADGMAPLNVALAEEPIPVAEVVVAASSFGKAGKGEGAVVRRMDVMTTPGGAGDVFQALRTLPGIDAPNEGAAVFVRGGDPHETLIRLDGGEIGHPYHYEGASGGLFSAFDSYMLKNAFFSSGGFTSKYGGVLSGVLDINTQDPMGLKTVSLGVNIVGGGISSSWALIPDKLSFVGSARISAVGLLYKLYGSAHDYVSTPASRDAAGRLLYRYSSTGRVSLLYLGTADAVGVISSHLNFTGNYDQRSHTHFGAMQFQDVIAGKVSLHGQLSGQRYRTHWTYGPEGIDEHEQTLQGNLEAVWPLSSRHELSFGGGAKRPDDRIDGALVADSTDFAPGAPTRDYTTHAQVTTPGFYLEDKLRVWGPLYATAGGRMDYASVPGVWTADPRVSLAWRIDDTQTLRLATGRYHQLPNAQYLDPVYGNPQLSPLAADHVIAGYEWKSGRENVRIEAYRKDYRGLVTNSARTFYANGGHGYARGIDVFGQGTHRQFTGWISYGFLDTKRQELDDPNEVPSGYGVRHSLTLVGEYQLTPFWQIGTHYNYTSGRPYTPIVGATFDPTRALWRPLYGAHGSALMPDYNRLDIRLTRLFSLPSGGGLPASSVCVFYIEAMNVLGTANVLDYVYNSDYTVRRANLSYFSRRIAVAGFGLTW